jgi:hypothetical protein
LVTAEMTDIKGAIVWRKSQVANDEILDFSFLAPGNYVMKLVSLSMGKTRVIKLIKSVR